jgi:exo-beta-1,3-glucanase (GH17 family)
MSNAYQRRLSLAGIDTTGLSADELRGLVRQILDTGIHGLCFSPYTDDQGPGAEISDAQARERLAVVAPHCGWVRTFSCTDGNERVPGIAKEAGLKTMVGVWLDDDEENNEEELANALAIARAGHADILAIGNEVLLREDLDEDTLINYIERARTAAPGVPVGYVDAYFKFEEHPRVSEACDVLLANCYPFWEGCPADYAILYMKEMYQRAVRCAAGKRVIVSETGWPNVGTACGGAEPSFRSAIKYFVDTCRWAEEDGIELFYFAAFDEAWKTGAEGDVGAYWGLWDKDGRPKYAKN